ncbi:MAG: PP2C family protein-serine/threonine phosphatase [Ignavibacteriales bacterium]|nr:PP2C family protein-serine/threonine phosphatase [Ignavibacteriales bacterium]
MNILFSRSSGERAAYETELLNARDTQKGLMPSGDPVIENYDISGMSLPATEVGGDYYDYIWLDEKQSKLGIAIADVSGKAMKAAMTAVMTSGMIYQETENSQSPKIILQKINRPMYLKTQKQMFTALSFAVIDLPSRSFTLSNAGQMHPMLRRGTEVRFLKVPGVRLPLGIMEEVHYSELEEQLNQGDIVFFYTDGIPEAMNKEKELFGFERMEQFVRTLSVDSTAKDITTQLFTAVQQHVGDAPQHDDMTVVVVKVQ